MINKICKKTFELSFEENQPILKELATISYEKIPKECYTDIEVYLSSVLLINNIEDESLISPLKTLLLHLRTKLKEK